MTISLTQAKKAQSILSAKFNDAASKLPVNGIGIQSDKNGLYISVNLERAPTKAESAQMPKKCEGVRVKYHVIGKIRPQ